MFGKAKTVTYYADEPCAAKTCEPTEDRMTAAQGQSYDARQHVEQQRENALRDLLEAISTAVLEGADPFRITGLAAAYKDIRGY